MQVTCSEMRSLRIFSLRRHLFTVSSQTPNLHLMKCPNYPPDPRKFHSTPHGRFSEPATWTVQANYDPSSGRVVTRREKQSNAEPDQPPSYTAIEEGRRTYGDVVGPSKHSDAKPDQPANYSAIEEKRRAYGEVVGPSGARGKKGKGKSKSVYVCENCGYSDGQWWGKCKQCCNVGTMKRFAAEAGSGNNGRGRGLEVSENAVRSWLPKQVTAAAPVKVTEVNSRINELNWRIPLPGQFGAEVERVLGGGLVPGSLVLVGGDPGVGKSTLLLQVAALIAEGNGTDDAARVVYVSGEESVEQIGNRADRLKIETEELFLYSSTDIEEILEQTQLLSPQALVIDSIQTVYLRGATGSAGGDIQVKECTSALLRFAKKTNIPVLLIGHVTKTGEIAGPRVLEHIVDVVLYMEGEKFSSHRLLRSVKNRFGSTDEIGVLQMQQSGLQGVSNPSEMYLREDHADSDYLAGLAVAVIMDGSRAFLIEIQALCVAGSSVSRQVNGVQGSRADMIISVIMKQAGLKLHESGIFVNVVSGISLKETSGDLAIAAAICSSFLEFPIPNGIAFIGEIGLGGELRTVPQLEKRVNTLVKLGYEKCVVPKSAEKSLKDLHPEGIEILGCRDLKEMIHKVFITDQ